MATQPENAEVNYADFAEDVTETTAEAPVVEERTEPALEDIEAAGDDTEDKPEADGDDLDDDLDLDDEKPTDGDEAIDLGDGVSLSKAELKEIVAQRETYSRYQDELKVVEKERAVLNEVYSDYSRASAMLQGQYDIALRMVHDAIPPAPPMDLLHTNPQLYMMQKEMRESEIAKYNQLKSTQAQALKEAEANSAAALQREASIRGKAEVDKLLAAVPALREGKNADKYLHSVVEAGKRYGYSADEVKETILRDHRAALILRKAAQFDAMRAKNVKPIPPAGAPRAIPAASRSQAPSQKSQDRRSLAATLAKAGNPSSSRSDLMDEAAHHFGD